MKDSYTDNVRTAIQSLAAAGKEISTDNVSRKIFVQTRKDNKRMLNALSDMFKAGELERLSRGVYVCANRNKPEEKRAVMWRVLRMRRAVCLDDMIEMAGVGADYAREWLNGLVKQGVVRRTDGTWRLIKDSLEMPELTANAEKLRALRAKKKKAALAALNLASDAIARAKNEINEL